MATTVSEEIAMLPDVRQFLELLPPGTPVFDGYEGQWQELQPQWQELLPDRFFDDHFVVFTHVSEHALDSTNDRLPGLVDYSPVLELLIFKMPSLVHEEAVRLFEGRLQIIANEMHVHRRLSYRGSSNVRAIDRTKQADATYAPRGQSRKWPTLAVEVGCSVTTAKLHGDMKFWINKSNGEVKRGITIDIKKSGTIIISSWVPDYTPVRTTTTTSGRHSAPSSELLPPPRKTDTITIKRGVRGQSHVIEGGDLVIPFRDLLLSDPGHAEHDFVFGKEFLLNDLAIRVWDAIEQGGPLVSKCVPGGFIVYLLIEELPGIRLSPDDSWKFSKEKRQEIREAFEDAYKEYVGRGIAPVEGALGTNLLWDEIQKKIYTVGFEDATTEDA